MSDEALQQRPDDAATDDAAHRSLRERARLAGLAAAAVAAVYLIAGSIGVDVPSPSALADDATTPETSVRVAPPKPASRATPPHSAPGNRVRPPRNDAATRKPHGRFERDGQEPGNEPAAPRGEVDPSPEPP